jgi:hypothetical protein
MSYHRDNMILLPEDLKDILQQQLNNYPKYRGV